MKKILLAGFSLWALSLSPVWSESPSDKKTDQDVQRVKKDYQGKVHKELREISVKIRHLKNQAAKAGDKLKADMDRDIKKLEAQKKGADRKLVELERSTGDAWKDLRKGLDQAVEDLKTAVDNSADQFKSKS